MVVVVIVERDTSVDTTSIHGLKQLFNDYSNWQTMLQNMNIQTNLENIDQKKFDYTKMKHTDLLAILIKFGFTCVSQAGSGNIWSWTLVGFWQGIEFKPKQMSMIIFFLHVYIAIKRVWHQKSMLYFWVYLRLSPIQHCVGGEEVVSPPPRSEERGPHQWPGLCSPPPHRLQWPRRPGQAGTTGWVGVYRQSDVRSPIVFEGVMMSRTNTYKNLYFVSFKVFRVLKGKIHRQLQGSKNMIMCIIFKMEKIRKMFEIWKMTKSHIFLYILWL